MFRWATALIDRSCAVIGAIVFAQFPLFIQQYTQQLLGREAELRLQVVSMKQSAALSGKTLEQLIAKFSTNPDVDVVRQGELMQNVVERWNSLSESLVTLQNSNGLEKPFIFLAHLNVEAFKSTLKNFTLGIPMNLEGGIYAVVGIAFGFLLFAISKRLLKIIFGIAYSKTKSTLKQERQAG